MGDLAEELYDVLRKHVTDETTNAQLLTIIGVLTEVTAETTRELLDEIEDRGL